jgi:hypothetical protein
MKEIVGLDLIGRFLGEDLAKILMSQGPEALGDRGIQPPTNTQPDWVLKVEESEADKKPAKPKRTVDN